MESLVNSTMKQLTTRTVSETEVRECCLCGKTVTKALEPFRSLDFKCDDCLAGEADASTARARQRAEDDKEQRLLAIPEAFRRTEQSKLPIPANLDTALRWEFGPRGLLFCGATGTGKSRIMWEVARREILAGRNIHAVNAFRLTRYPALFMAGDDAAGKVADEMAKADLLLLDDVFKAKATERVEELLFAVIDERGSHERPCLITVNDTGASLEGRLSADRGPALIRRLREYCDPILFRAPASKIHC